MMLPGIVPTNPMELEISVTNITICRNLRPKQEKFAGPFSSTNFALTYQYTLGGQLKKITDHTNSTIAYDYSKTGDLTAVTGENNLVAGVSNYASGLSDRAFGALRDIAYGNGTQQHVDYNRRWL